ncbi:MAG: flavodoxin family protein [Calditrichaeota bacterium]|nr:MAG: flavodoxin family protein [Calditrichota bacterium]
MVMRMRKFLLVSVLMALMSGHEAMAGGTPAKVLIVYYSARGHTRAMAEAVARGANTVSGVSVQLLPVEKATNRDVLAADAIILGTPVYNANVAPPIQKFINHWPFRGAPLRNKIGAAFVTAGGISAGEELTQVNLLHSMLIFGMIIVGGPHWQAPFGASGVTEEEPFKSAKGEKLVQPHFLQKGEALGQRVAEIVRRFKRAGR